jgi:hypothetical protein
VAIVGGRAALIAIGIVLLSTMPRGSNQILKLRVRPVVSIAPSDLWITVSIERRPENRLLRIRAESPNFLRTSDTQLDGEASPRQMVFTYQRLPAGSYDVEATLIGSNGRIKEATHVNVYFVDTTE